MAINKTKDVQSPANIDCVQPHFNYNQHKGMKKTLSEDCHL